MRYYVFCESDEPAIEPYIMGEVVRDTAGDRSLSLAAALAGPRSRILTRTELVNTAEGRRALECWDVRDDFMFEAESSLLERGASAGSVRLHVVGADEREPARHTANLPLDERMRQTILMSRGLRQVTRQVIQRARAVRAELHDRKREERIQDDEAGEHAV